MKERLRQIERLSRLREAQERMREAELAREQALFVVEQQRAAGARASVAAEVFSARELLLSGDTVASRMAEQAGTLAAAWQSHCDQRAATCAKRVDTATQRYRESRLQVEQSTRLAGTISRDIAVEEQRRFQASSDERFATRQHWTAGRAARRATEEDL